MSYKTIKARHLSLYYNYYLQHYFLTYNKLVNKHSVGKISYQNLTNNTIMISNKRGTYYSTNLSILKTMKHQDLLGVCINNYNIIKILGQGQFSIVYEAFNDKDNTTVAIKAIPMSLLLSDKKIKQLAQTEIKIMKSLKENPNIIRFIDNFKNSKTVFIVMQLCDKGTLQEQIIKKKSFSEDDAKEILIQLINGFRGLHQFNIIHRDFKADNIMIKGDKYKIADLGFAKMLQNKNQLASTSLGTPVTQAPEIYDNLPYGMKADIWSLGVVFYQMIYGKYPYFGATEQMIYEQSKKPPSFSGVNISDITKDFILRCLTFDPEKRISWQELYEHKLLNQKPLMRKIGSLQSSNYFNMNRFFYKQKPKPRIFNHDQNISQMDVIEGQKMQKADLQKVKKQNELKKKMQTAINNYKDEYLNYRNIVAVLLKYLFPNACYIKKLPIEHEKFLFDLCRWTYQKLRTLYQQTKNNVDFLNLKEFFVEFTKSKHYQQLIQIFKDDAELAFYQTQEYKKDFNSREIKDMKSDKQINQIAFGYENLLTDGLDIIKNDFPKQKLIVMIQALECFRKCNLKEKFQKFQKQIQTLDFNKAPKMIRERQVEQLSLLYA